jgi:hypothetical protein
MYVAAHCARHVRRPRISAAGRAAHAHPLQAPFAAVPWRVPAASLRRAHKTCRHALKPRCFTMSYRYGFVRYATVGEAEACIQGLDGTIAALGHTLQVKFADADAGPPSVGIASGHTRSDSCYVRQLPATYGVRDSAAFSGCAVRLTQPDAASPQSCTFLWRFLHSTELSSDVARSAGPGSAAAV